MLTAFKEKFGPGLLYAAVAVGVSHLVQSTRAGATFGMIMVGYVVFVCLLKYPTFLFGARYTAATGETLLDGYEKMGRWVLYLFFAMQIFEYTFAISGVALTTVGLLQSVLGTDLPDLPFALGVLIIAMVILAVGRYALLEDITKILVITFTVATVIAGVVAIGSIDTSANDWDVSMSLSEMGALETTVVILFLVSVAGWMPTGTAGSVGLSLWVKAKSRRLGRPIPVEEASFDFNVGYFTAIFTAICFVAMGSYVMYANGVPLEEDATGFATQLMDLFTSTIGAWVYPVIAIAAVTVMFSTLLTLVDLLPRTSSEIIGRLWPEQFGSKEKGVALYLGFIVLELFLVLSVLLVLMDSFATFIDMITSMGFIVAPVISLLNHLAIFSPLVPKDKQPGPVLKAWSWVTIVSLTLVAVMFVILRY